MKNIDYVKLKHFTKLYNTYVDQFNDELDACDDENYIRVFQESISALHTLLINTMVVSMPKDKILESLEGFVSLSRSIIEEHFEEEEDQDSFTMNGEKFTILQGGKIDQAIDEGFFD